MTNTDKVPTSISEMWVVLPGSGYIPGEYDAVIKDKSGSGAAATVTVDSNGEVTKISLTEHGLGYVAPTVSLPSGAGDGTGALMGAKVVPPLPVHYIAIRAQASGWQPAGWVVYEMTVANEADLPVLDGKIWVADPECKYHENDVYPIPKDEPGPVVTPIPAAK